MSARQYAQRNLCQRFLKHAAILAFDLSSPTQHVRRIDLDCRIETMELLLPLIDLTEATKNFPATLNELRAKVKSRRAIVSPKRTTLRLVQS